MIKTYFFSVIIILTSVVFVFSQSAEKGNAPNIKLMLLAENTEWKKGSTASVKIIIENLSDSKIELPTRIDFKVDGVTVESGDFYAPFSLTKTYDKDTKTCQNNLTDKNVKKVGGLIEIYPDKNSIGFNGKEKKDFKIDLIGLCWARSLSSFYPSENLFTIASIGSYKLYFVMQFDAGIKEYKGIKYRAVEEERSNEVQFEIRK